MIRNPFSLICLITMMPGPPGFYYENIAYMTLYPVDKTICPKIDPYSDILFELHTPKNPIEPQYLLLNKNETIKDSNLDFNKKTVIYFHGFMENGKYGSAKAVGDAYMQRNDYNFIVVNAEKLIPGPWFITAVRNLDVIGKYAANFIDYLVTQGLKLKTVHLIGHSLGAHSAGIAGHYVKSGKIPRITGLDPAKPILENAPLDKRLDSTDAEFVDVIHTSGLGLQQAIGHANFYPNGGTVQPGCSPIEIYQRNPSSILEQIFCHHWRSFLFYSESVTEPKSFAATACDSWNDYSSGKCHDQCSCMYMGFSVNTTLRGKFYLRTNKEPPYSIFIN